MRKYDREVKYTKKISKKTAIIKEGNKFMEVK